ncbi:PI-PLC X domain-containing protein 1-like [Argiope bruennichi]|uniref:PI-PLC X domain-containing protein 1-like n=1 Tax=Argiope bruennichi TaxID=94029 RepID=UPI002494A349|nr:PI-PLC X domain-containing protein 1-like [Argiope bruennichi]XP_055932460.1 PI-PLC X domain-containing protein 1-like [Argiope bruennichi]XP_055932461.1 PI-PLC X domain-containing protein 1-like [Argiope bruennichi]XP_055932462.1 PI-PLC X domain-containing protein 1-like [Argiope bruennichi]
MSLMSPKNNLWLWRPILGLLFAVQCQAYESFLLDRDVPNVYLTVSSVVSQSGAARLLELNWLNLPNIEGVSVHLYGRDPSLSSGAALVTIRPTTTSGYHKTSVQFPEQVFYKSNLTSSCLGFWIAYRLNDVLVTSNCIRSRPHWMHESRSTLGNLTLLDLMIPGTHNAGCYSPFNAQEDTMFTRYLYTQEESIWNQLVFGIRYLDLRVAYSQTSDSPNEKFWITHSSFKTDITVMDVVRQVKEFLKATREIVIMDFHRFVNGFQRKTASTRRRHRDLIALLERELEEFMIPVHYTSGATLEQLWNSDKRLYVGYADERARTRSLYLFPAVKHLWGDKDKAGDLWSYLNGTVCNPSRSRLTSAMAQLTPTKAGALFNLYGGLRKMAEQVNRQVTRWFSYDWNDCANIVATDFFLGNNIIELAIETNKRRLPYEVLL